MGASSHQIYMGNMLLAALLAKFFPSSPLTLAEYAALRDGVKKHFADVMQRNTGGE
jgi:hypothetical protein